MHDSFPIIMREEQRGRGDVTVFSTWSLLNNAKQAGFSSVPSVHHGSESAAFFESNCGHLAASIASLNSLFPSRHDGGLVLCKLQDNCEGC